MPKAIAVMLSYEAERRAVEAAGYDGRAYDDRPVTRRCSSGWPATGPQACRPSRCSTHRSLLARVGDPLEVARTLGVNLPVSREALLDVVRDRVRDLLSGLPEGSAGIGTPDQRWYWAAPFLLDRGVADVDNEPFLRTDARRGSTPDGEDQESRLGAHLRAAADVQRPRPRSAARRSR